MEVELMVTKHDNNQRPTGEEQSASGRLEGRVLQYQNRTQRQFEFCGAARMLF